jgi:hypothetical protein
MSLNNQEEVGKLGFPNVSLQDFLFTDNFSIRCWRYYSKLVETTELGTKTSAFLKSDKRCKSLEGRLLSSGSGAEIYDAAKFAQWFIWRANHVGASQAWEEIETYLNNDSVEVMCTLWVLGLETPRAVKLGDGITLLPAKEMPDCTDKEFFLQHEIGIHAPRVKPLAALTKICRVKKIFETFADGTPQSSDNEYSLASEQLHQLATLINSLPGACCVPYFSTSYSVEHTPLGPFSGSGGGMPVFDVVTFARTNFPTDYVTELIALLKSYSNYEQPEQARLARILMRISQAKRRLQLEDKILDFGIAMEMLLLDDNEKDQLSLSFRLRGSWILSSSKEDRKEKYDLLKKMYNLRSSVAHTGTIHGGAPQKVQAAIDLVPSFQALSEDAARKIIRDGSPDWDLVVLNLSD